MSIKILCIQLKQIGDVLMTTPAIRSLAEHFPSAEIHYLTQPPSHQIFECNPYVHKILEFPRKANLSEAFQFLQKIQKEKYQVVIDFFGQPKTAILSWLTKAKTRIGFQFQGRSFFYTHPLSPPAHLEYSVFHKMYLLYALGIEEKNWQIDFFIEEKDRKYARDLLKELNINPTLPLVTVSPVSRRDYKVWPPENFATVCDFLIQQYKAQILFLWGPKEKHFVDATRKHMKFSSLSDYDIPTIRQTVAILEQADIHLGNDNGPMHFAIAAKRPTVAVFGRPKPVNWMPPNQVLHLAFEYDPGCKDACYYPQCQLECIRQAPVKTGIELVQKQMEIVLAKKLENQTKSNCPHRS